MVRVFQVLPLEGVGVSKNGGRFLKRDTMLFPIPEGFSGIPGEYIYVYTIIIAKESRSKLSPFPAVRSTPRKGAVLTLSDHDARRSRAWFQNAFVCVEHRWKLVC
jgi:hypothetical protein